MRAQRRGNCANHPYEIVLDLGEYVRTWQGSGEDPYGSAKSYRGYYVGGRVAGRRGWVFDEPRLNQDLVDAVGHLEGAWQPYSCAVRDQGVPSSLPEAVEVRLGIGGTGLWWGSGTVARRWGAVVDGPSAGGQPCLGGKVVPEDQEGREDRVSH